MRSVYFHLFCGMIRSIGIILTLLVLSLLGHAQGNRTYSGPYQVLDYSGAAQFEYITEDGDTIFNGPFRMEQSSLDALLNNGDHFFFFEGNFTEGLPQNRWTFQFGEFQKGSGTAVSNYQYNVKINGSQHDASGILANGKLQGPWIHEVVRIENSEVGELLFRSTIQFENGIPKQNFKIEDENRVLARVDFCAMVWRMINGSFIRKMVLDHLKPGFLAVAD